MHATDLSGKSARNPHHPNRHPVDRLADVRAAIKALSEEEGELKKQVTSLMGRADSLGGDEYIASQKLQERKGSLDEARLAAEGIDLDLYRKPASTFIVISVERRVAEVA